MCTSMVLLRNIAELSNNLTRKYSSMGSIALHYSTDFVSQISLFSSFLGSERAYLPAERPTTAIINNISEALKQTLNLHIKDFRKKNFIKEYKNTQITRVSHTYAHAHTIKWN